MRANLLIPVFLLTSSYGFGQINFENGYFIDNDNHKITCLIKNSDWRNSPMEFEYKPKDKDASKKADVTNVKEFGIYGYSKFIRAEVQIDRSPMELSSLSNSRNPIWSTEKLFLKVILEGKASLYSYNEKNFERFFYSLNNAPIKQLIFKEYIYSDNNLSKNNEFRQQLWNTLKCEEADIKSMQYLSYTLSDLKAYFKKYNECSGSPIIVYSTKKGKDFFNLGINPGINYSAMTISNSAIDNDVDLTSTGFRLGIESEFIMPFNKNKWGIIFEPTFQTFKGKEGIADVNLKFIEFPLGLRHYFYLNQNARIFLNAYYITSFSLNFNSSLNYSLSSLKISPRDSYALGGGIDYKRLSAEIRYYTNRDLVSDYSMFHTDYSRISFMFGYKILQVKR